MSERSVSRIVLDVMCLADLLAARNAERGIPTGELYRNVAYSNWVRAREALREYVEQAITANPPQTQAARDVLSERQRQISVEGWTPEHDDSHESGELARAAACYAVGVAWQQFWPESWDWKYTNQRRMLVKAGALIIAEIERLDRASTKEST